MRLQISYREPKILIGDGDAHDHRTSTIISFPYHLRRSFHRLNGILLWEASSSTWSAVSGFLPLSHQTPVQLQAKFITELKSKSAN